jgi:hypothetical protein
MGRGQSLVKDAFTSVLGNQRGSNKGEVENDPLVLWTSTRMSTFGSNTPIALRRLRILNWMLIQQANSADGNKIFRTYREIFNTAQAYQDVTNAQKCRSDLYALLERKVLERDLYGDEDEFAILPVDEWSQEHKKEFLIWAASPSNKD